MFCCDASGKPKRVPSLEETLSVARVTPMTDGPLEVTGPYEIVRQDGDAVITR